MSLRSREVEFLAPSGKVLTRLPDAIPRVAEEARRKAEREPPKPSESLPPSMRYP